jgi:hypothetical protein
MSTSVAQSALGGEVVSCERRLYRLAVTPPFGRLMTFLLCHSEEHGDEAIS